MAAYLASFSQYNDGQWDVQCVLFKALHIENAKELKGVYIIMYIQVYHTQNLEYIVVTSN